jgi:translocation and assembly module TamA
LEPLRQSKRARAHAGNAAKNKRWCAVLLISVVAGCASVPHGQVGVRRLRFEGTQQIDADTLAVCLSTHEREAVEFGLTALREPECGKPPFDRARASVRLWSWPWKTWPTYDEAVLKLDLERIQRWYQARGYYRAHVTKVEFKPSGLKTGEACPEPCKARITITVLEGEPVRLRKLSFQGLEQLTPKLQKDLTKALDLKPGAIFDEALYHEALDHLTTVMRDASFARAKIEGEVQVHRGLLYADLTIHVTPGPKCTVGEVRVKSTEPVPNAPVLAAAKLKRGELYKESDLSAAEHAVYALGAFSAARVHGDFSGDSSEIPVIIELSPRKRSEPAVGVGVMSGVLATGPMAQETLSVPQWDVHLLGSYTHRNFLGGLRQLHIEERPRLLFLGPFPSVPNDSPRFANNILVRFIQPGALEPRTRLVVESNWDYGPDPFLLFFRHDLTNAVGLERGFFNGRLSGRVATHFDLMDVAKRQPIVHNNVPSSYRLPFLEQTVSLDLRDDAAKPTKGGYLALGSHEAIPVGDQSWSYLRLTPDARGYVPLGLGLVLAARFALGSIHIFHAGNGLDPDSKRLGPQTYRLRGGGANSNRGFAPGQLGDGLSGGIRRWESSLELRVPLSKDFSVVAFGDAGDVHAGKSFRFNNLNTAVGGGLRYRTLIGPVRLDVGYRPPALARADGSKPSNDPTMNLGFTRFHGAVHLTIGEAF